MLERWLGPEYESVFPVILSGLVLLAVSRVGKARTEPGWGPGKGSDPGTCWWG